MSTNSRPTHDLFPTLKGQVPSIFLGRTSYVPDILGRSEPVVIIQKRGIDLTNIQLKETKLKNTMQQQSV